jgi:Family of unknown function (DUF6338)
MSVPLGSVLPALSADHRTSAVEGGLTGDPIWASSAPHFAAFVMPGFIFQAARVRFRGQLPGERDQFSRALRALGISFAFVLIYYASFSGAIQATVANPEVIFERPVKAALVALAIVFVDDVD